MRVKLITLRYAPSLGGFDDRPLAEFIRDKEVLAVREHFFTVHDLPHVACMVTYQDPSAPGALLPSQSPGSAPRMRPDVERFTELTPELRVLFNTLREWRASQSRKDGVAPYMILTNRELFAIVKGRPRTMQDLSAIQGIGPARLAKYGQRILNLLGPRSDSPVAEAPGADRREAGSIDGQDSTDAVRGASIPEAVAAPGVAS